MSDIVHDRIAIEETKARYCRFLDTKDWEGFASTFTEDLRQDTSDSGGPVLSGRDTDPAFSHLSASERAAILQILNNTDPAFARAVTRISQAS